MADEQQAATEQTEKPAQAQFGIESIYLKDLSLECPQGASAFGKEYKPRVNLDINNAQSKLADDVYEVVLRLTITVQDNESSDNIYLVEIQQAGAFRVTGLPDQELRRVLATVAPATLFPYARETIDSLVTKANFPPLRLAPINFDALLAEAVKRQQQAEANQSAETTETVQ